MRRGEELAITHPLAKLRPFIDDTGVMRVGGRIRRSGEASEAEKFPVLLHTEHHGCRALVRAAHEGGGHGGRSATLHQLLCLGVWIPRVRRVVDSLIHHCVKCRRISGREVPQMVEDMSTDSFITAPRRLEAVRGRVQQLHCDRGTNFVGAATELQGDGRLHPIEFHFDE